MEIEDRTVRSDLYRQLEHATYSEDDKTGEPWAPIRYKIADISDALGAIGHTEADRDPPAGGVPRGPTRQ